MQNLPGLQHQAAACEEVCALIAEENRILKLTGRAPDDSFLARKRAGLNRLEESLNELRAGATKIEAEEARILATRNQQMIMRALLIDRENEQLLLKATMGTRPAAPMPKTSPAQISRTYKGN